MRHTQKNFRFALACLKDVRDLPVVVLESLPVVIGGCRGKTARLVKATDRNTGRQSLGLAGKLHILKISRKSGAWCIVKMRCFGRSVMGKFEVLEAMDVSWLTDVSEY